MQRFAFAGLGVLVLAGCDRSPTLPTTQEQPAFAVVAGGGPPFNDVSAGDGFSCALSRRGDVYCWGVNQFGTLGAGDLRFQSIDAGWRHNCGLTAQGDAYCWGWNQFGQLGTTTTETCLTDGVVLN